MERAPTPAAFALVVLGSGAVVSLWNYLVSIRPENVVSCRRPFAGEGARATRVWESRSLPA